MVTFNEPAVIVNAPAMPITALLANAREVPLIVTLKRFAVPLNSEDPVNVIVPVEAIKLPVQLRELAIVKLLAVLMLPLAITPRNVSVPELVIVFPDPLNVMIPLLAINDPLAEISPLIVAVQVVVTMPVMLKLFRLILVPVNVFVVPVIVNNPVAWLKAPDPDVMKLPEILMAVTVGAVILEPVIVIL